MTKKRKQSNPTIYVEGNNGGDYLLIEKLGGSLIRLEVGHCCVHSIDRVVPIEFITAMLSEAVYAHGGVEAALRSVNWPADFVEKLCGQLKNMRSPAQEDKDGKDRVEQPGRD